MPKRMYPRPLIYEQLCAERLIDPLRDREKPMGRHDDLDGDGLADQSDRDPLELRAESDQGWCEDRADPDSWDDLDIDDTPEAPDALAD